MHEDVTFTLVDTAGQLGELCALIDGLSEQDYIGLDTEFMRVTCYYPDFSLLQLAIEGTAYLVDVWMLEGHVKPLIQSLCETKALVLTFACSEDLELLAHESRRCGCSRVLPEHLYDLQLMLAFCGHSFGRGLRFAIQEFLHIELAKDCTRSDWMARPLSQEQLIYGALDVFYLEELFLCLKDKIQERQFTYFMSEMEAIKHHFDTEPDEDEAYLSISAAGMLNASELNVLHYLARERMLYAQMENQALNRIITSKAMWQLARYTPRSKKELLHRGVKAGTVRLYGDEIVGWIYDAVHAPRYKDLTLPYDYFSHQRVMQPNYDLLKDTILQKIEHENICPQVICQRKLLNDYFRALYLKQTPLLQQSWRKEVLGELSIPIEPVQREEDPFLDKNFSMVAHIDAMFA